MTDAWFQKLQEQWLPQLEAGQMSPTELAERILREQYVAGSLSRPIKIADVAVDWAKSSMAQANQQS